MHQKEGAGNYAKAAGIEYTIKSFFLEMKRRRSQNNYYYYRFDGDVPGWDDPGVFHSVDLWFFFETLAKCWRPFVGRHYDLARQMCNYWANFIRTGNPNGEDVDGTTMPEWEPYSEKTPCEMVFGKEGAVSVREEVNPFRDFLIEALGKRLQEG